MATFSDPFIRFGCHRCTTPLKAPAKYAGRKQRCPLCYVELVVPQKSRPVGEAYGMLQGDAPPPPSDEIVVHCSVCHSRLTATAEQVGQTIVCPDCGTPARVPPRTPPRRRHRQLALDDYAMCADVDPAAPVTPPKELIRVFCSLCHTLMYATAEQVGQTLVCPDCGTQTAVLPSEHRPEGHGARFRTAVDDEYDVHANAFLPSSSAAHQRHVGFKCTRCGSRIHATLAEVGRTIECHDCGTINTVPPPVERPKVTQENPGDYAADPTRRPPLVFKPIFAGPRRLGRRGGGTVEVDDYYAPPIVIRRPMVAGVFGFPWRGDVVGQWLILSLIAALGGALVLCILTVSSGIQAGGGFGGVGVGVLSVVGVLAFTKWLIIGGGLIAVSLLSVLCDTANGGDTVAEWPSVYTLVEWLLTPFYIYNPLAYSILPGALVAWIGQYGDLSLWWLVPISIVVFFPFVMLSSLERGTPLAPFSLAIFRSLWQRLLPWMMFYAESTAVLAVAGLPVVVAIMFGGPWLALTIAAPLGMAAALIYFRLLGRLGWCCSR